MNEDRTPAPGVNAIDFYRDEIDRLRATAAWDIKILNGEIYLLNNRILEWGDKYADLSNETDRLRAENAELRKYLQDINDRPQLFTARAILAKTAKEGE